MNDRNDNPPKMLSLADFIERMYETRAQDTVVRRESMLTPEEMALYQQECSPTLH